MPLSFLKARPRPKKTIPLAQGFISIIDLPPQVREVATLRGIGLSVTRIGVVLRLPRRRVVKLLTSYRRPFKSLRLIMGERTLSSRAVNSLGLCGIHSAEEALGRGYDDVLQALRALPNCGPATRSEIVGWMRQHAPGAHVLHADSSRAGGPYAADSSPTENAPAPAMFASSL